MMNANNLAKQYDKLTALERFPLICAAVARNDEAERTRLLQSAPRNSYSVPDYWGVADSFLLLSKLEFMELLNMSASYLEECATAAATKTKRGADPIKPWHPAMAAGFVFRLYLAGWRQFCAGLNIDPEWLWQCFPGFGTIQRAEQRSGPNPESGFPGPAFKAEGFARYMARLELGVDPEAEMHEATWQKFQPVTPQDIATSLRTTWEELRKKWR
jgi:hypothetical protein